MVQKKIAILLKGYSKPVVLTDSEFDEKTCDVSSLFDGDGVKIITTKTDVFYFRSEDVLSVLIQQDDTK